jgi:hypothetical protein
VLLKTREQAAEREQEIKAAQDNVGLNEREDEKKKEDQFLSRFSDEEAYLEDRNGGMRAEEHVERSSYLDAEGRDPYGYKYDANFGYDAQHNYHDSYGNTLNTKTYVATTAKGNTVDLKHGITRTENLIYDHVTHTGMQYDPDKKQWFLLKYDENGKADFAEKDPKTNEPIAHTKEEAEAWAVKITKDRPPESDEQCRKWEEADKNNDVARAGKVNAGNTNGTTRPGQTNETETTKESTTTAVAGILGGPGGNVIVSREEEATKAEAGGIDLFKIHARQLEASVTRGHAVSFSAKVNIGTNEVDFAPLRDAKLDLGSAGQVDREGGYFDKQGGYADKFGGYRAADGSFTDKNGNYVDVDGNLWLANNKTGKPDFMKQDGIDYADMLKKRQDGTIYKWFHDNSQMALRTQDIQKGLSDVDAAWDKQKAANTAENRAYQGRDGMTGTFVDKQGNLWLNGHVDPIPGGNGVDYVDLVKKAEKGKLDDWKSTGNLTPAEIAEVKAQVQALIESKFTEAMMSKQIDDLSAIADAAKNGQRWTPKEEASPKSKFAPKEQKPVVSSFGRIDTPAVSTENAPISLKRDQPKTRQMQTVGTSP